MISSDQPNTKSVWLQEINDFFYFLASFVLVLFVIYTTESLAVRDEQTRCKW